MNLTEMLSYADIAELSRIARTYECECNGHSKHELIQSILTAFGRRDVFERQIESLSIEKIRLLNSIVTDNRETYSLEELTARVKHAAWDSALSEAGSPRDVIVEFKRKGWLFSGYSPQTKTLFQVPDDLKRRFADLLTKHFRKTVVAASPPSVYRDEQHLIADDIAQFLRALQQQEIRLSDNGAIYKRELQQLLDTFTVNEELVGRTAWRFGYGRKFKEYPSRFSLLYDYCYFHDYIQEEPFALRLTEKGRQAVLAGGREPIASVYAFWLRLYKGPVPSIHSVVRWIERLARQWVTLESLRDALVPLIKPYYYDSPESIFQQRIVHMMMHLGLLRIGRDERHGETVQLTKLGSDVICGSKAGDMEEIRLEAPDAGSMDDRVRYEGDPHVEGGPH